MLGFIYCYSNCADKLYLPYFCGGPNESTFEFLTAQFNLKNMLIVIYALIFRCLCITISILPTKNKCSTLHFKPVLFTDLQYSRRSTDFSTDTSLHEMEVLRTCHQQHKIQGTTPDRYIQTNIECLGNRNSKKS